MIEKTRQMNSSIIIVSNIKLAYEQVLQALDQSLRVCLNSEVVGYLEEYVDIFNQSYFTSKNRLQKKSLTSTTK